MKISCADSAAAGRQAGSRFIAKRADRSSVPPELRPCAPSNQAPQESFVPAPVEARKAPESAKSFWHKAGTGMMATMSLLGVVGLAGCGQAPPPSEGVQTSWTTDLTYQWMSTEQEVQLGESVAAQVEAEYGVWNNQAAQARIDRLAARLTPHSVRSDINYEFKLLDSPVVNAMAVPGGKIYVTRGLYERYQNDEQLLFVMGHEMGHIEHRHSIRQLGKQALIDIAIRLTLDPGDNSEFMARIGEQILNNRISQSDEHESDHAGQAHLIQMGINPWQAVRAMEILAEGHSHQPEIVTEILGSHPPNRQRVEALVKGAEGFEMPEGLQLEHQPQQ